MFPVSQVPVNPGDLQDWYQTRSIFISIILYKYLGVLSEFYPKMFSTLSMCCRGLDLFFTVCIFCIDSSNGEIITQFVHTRGTCIEKKYLYLYNIMVYIIYLGI